MRQIPLVDVVSGNKSKKGACYKDDTATQLQYNVFKVNKGAWNLRYKNDVRIRMVKAGVENNVYCE